MENSTVRQAIELLLRHVIDIGTTDMQGENPHQSQALEKLSRTPVTMEDKNVISFQTECLACPPDDAPDFLPDLHLAEALDSGLALGFTPGWCAGSIQAPLPAAVAHGRHVMSALTILMHLCISDGALEVAVKREQRIPPKRIGGCTTRSGTGNEGNLCSVLRTPVVLRPVGVHRHSQHPSTLQALKGP
jgi:hypothetical protein